MNRREHNEKNISLYGKDFMAGYDRAYKDILDTIIYEMQTKQPKKVLHGLVGNIVRRHPDRFLQDTAFKLLTKLSTEGETIQHDQEVLEFLKIADQIKDDILKE